MRDGLARLHSGIPRAAYPTGKKCGSVFALALIRFTGPGISPSSNATCTYFLGVMSVWNWNYQVVCFAFARMSKEDYARLGLADGKNVSFQIRT